jgi:NTP pyrophosphatase (non-canonical NTP hydrolase)
MSEIGEAIEADRSRPRAMTEEQWKMQDFTDAQIADDQGFISFYDECIKGSVEEEFADIVIRLLDYARMKWRSGIDFSYEKMYRRNDWGFPEHAWYLCKYVLNTGYMNIADSIGYVMDWADDLGINLERHIEWKIRYNSLRPYRHGGKRY